MSPDLTLPHTHLPAENRFASWWHNLELASKLDFFLILILLPIVLIVLVLGSLATRVEDKTASTGNYRGVIFAVYELQIAMLNVETGYRGYALSGNRNFLEPYTEGLQAEMPALKKLLELNLFPEEVARLKDAVQAYEAWIVSSLPKVTLGQTLTDSQQQRLLDEGKTRFDALRGLFSDLNQKATTVFLSTRGEVVSDIRVQRYLPWLVFAVVVIAAWLVRIGLQQVVVLPIKRLEGAAQRLADGDGSLRLDVRSGDEMGTLARTFNQTAETLAKRENDLLRSNQELEQFAYVASHDLQEPLRMVSSYTQLLGKRYRGKLDEKADLYIHYAVDGANRMQALIQDLLRYSRVGTQQAPLVAVDSNAIVGDALNSLEVTLQESGTQVAVGELPIVLGDRVQLTQLFQNLIGNALKFRRQDVQPEVGVTASRDGEMWHFVVKDNGIGINPEYFERVFVIFQRLNTREEFSGSGIGLSICKKIVERHGGRIWVSSQAEQGSEFHFTLRPAE